MSDVKLTFILLNGICFLAFLLGGRMLAHAKNTRDYYLKGAFLILIYTIVHGLRFGRDIDWNIYYLRYKSIGESLNNEDYEPLFSIICHVFYNLGISYYIFIFLQCAFLMFSIIVLLKNYKKYAVFITPLLLPLIHTNDCYIRWWFAVSFVFLAIDGFLNRRYVKTTIFLIASLLIHYGVVVFVPIFFVASFVGKFVISPKIATILIIISSFVVSLSSFTFLVNLSTQLLGYGIGAGNEKAEIYLTSTQDLIDGDFGRLGYYSRSISNKLRFIISVIPAIWFMREYVDKIKFGRFFYNLFVIGSILKPVFLVEILDRYASFLSFFSCIVCGVFFYYVWKYRYTKPIIVTSVSLLSFAAAVWPGLSIAWSFDSDLSMMYIWNSGNRTYLPW